MPDISARAVALHPSVFIQLAERRAQRAHKILPLHIGDTYLLPPVRLSALDAPDDPALYCYRDPAGEISLREAFAADLGRRGLGLSPEEIIVTGGATHGLFLVALSLLEPGDEVLLAAPYWPLIPNIVRAVGGVGVEAPLFDALQTGADASALLAEKITPRTKAIYFASPNNPDGAVLSRAQLLDILNLAEKHDLWVIADEVYESYVYEGEEAVAAYSLNQERVISAYSLSKSHALAGVRLGFIVAPPALIKILRRLLTHTLFQVPLYAQRLGLRSLAEGAAWVEDARRRYREARDLVCDTLSARFTRPRAGAYVFLDLAREAKGDIWRVIDAALDAGISLAPGEAFGPSFSQKARLCFTAAPLEELAWGLPRLNEVLQRLRL